jgi:Amidohydrolase family
MARVTAVSAAVRLPHPDRGRLAASGRLLAKGEPIRSASRAARPKKRSASRESSWVPGERPRMWARTAAWNCSGSPAPRSRASVWGMITRGTKAAGVQGPEHAIDVATALRLYTMGTAALNHEPDRLGSITPGKLADLVAYPLDPLTADPDDLAELTPAFTIVGGRAVHDPDSMLGS